MQDTKKGNVAGEAEGRESLYGGKVELPPSGARDRKDFSGQRFILHTFVGGWAWQMVLSSCVCH